VQVESGLKVDDMEVACDAAIAGLGFAQLSGYVALEAIRAGRLVPVLPHTAENGRSFSVVYLHRTEVQPLRDRLFVDHLLVSAADRSAFELTPAELRHWSGQPAHAGQQHRGK
jgi:DNA-binding transcriptional LysR family regulator